MEANATSALMNNTLSGISVLVFVQWGFGCWVSFFNAVSAVVLCKCGSIFKSNYDLQIFSLSLTDITVGLFVILTCGVVNFYPLYYRKYEICAAVNVIYLTPQAVALCQVLCICYERYRILRSHQTKGRKRKIICRIVLTWLASLAVMTWPYVAFRRPGETLEECTFMEVFQDKHLIVWTNVGASLTIALFATNIVYFKLFRTLTRYQMAIKIKSEAVFRTKSVEQDKAKSQQVANRRTETGKGSRNKHKVEVINTVEKKEVCGGRILPGTKMNKEDKQDPDIEFYRMSATPKDRDKEQPPGECSQDSVLDNITDIGESSVKLRHKTQQEITRRSIERLTSTQAILLPDDGEIGHNLGSEHDPETDSCAPSERHGGRYVMYPWAVHGYDDNNQFFSPCSREYIFKVAKAKGYDCFTERKDDGVFCGNGRLDEGETCDGGWETQNDKDPCCNSTCHLRDGMECSPMNYACCEKCHVASSRKKCQEEALNSCEPEVLCDGVSLTCPKTGDKSSTDNRSCIDEGICKNGNCLNYCQRINITLTPCICPQASGQACYRCCKPSGGACESYRNTLLPDGRPCFQGICKKGVCAKQRVDMVERLFSLIDDITVDKLVEFMRSNIVGTVIVLSLIIWIPASCTFSYIDKRNEREEKASRNWMSRSNHTLLMDEDKPRIRHITNPRILRHQASVIRAQMAGEEGHHLDESVV